MRSFPPRMLNSPMFLSPSSGCPARNSSAAIRIAHIAMPSIVRLGAQAVAFPASDLFAEHQRVAFFSPLVPRADPCVRRQIALAHARGQAAQITVGKIGCPGRSGSQSTGQCHPCFVP